MKLSQCAMGVLVQNLCDDRIGHIVGLQKIPYGLGSDQYEVVPLVLFAGLAYKVDNTPVAVFPDSLDLLS